MAVSDWLALASDLRRNPLGALAKLWRKPLPTTRGTLHLGGLRAPIEVLRDAVGVPHVYARDLEDLVFAQGFVHAQDRFWQMELNRRVGRGRLAELFGAIAVDTDKLIRTIGLGRVAEKSLAQSSSETRALLEAYARGVNACLALGKRPLELTLLRHEPEPWQPLDSLAWAQMMAFTLSANWDSELLHGALVARLGPERAAKLRGELPSENPIVVPGQSWAALYTDAIARMRGAAELMPLAFGGASNNWVVDASKSSTGRPLLANDPHLALQMPSIWYEAHLSCPELEAAGVSLPGAPGIVLGHNARIAWGMTAALVDTVDLFVEKSSELGETQVIRDEVRVKGAQPVPFEIVITKRGPIVSGLGPTKANGHQLAMKWAVADGNRVHEAMFGLDRARNWDEFRAACALWDAPAMNVVYADVDGHIGYQLVGRVPVRKRGEGLLPAPADGTHDWTRTLSTDELPHALDPPSHYVASANNRIAGKEYPHLLGHDFMNGFRARRIVELLEAKPKHSPDDFARMHVDQYCRPAVPFCRLVVELRGEILAQPMVAPVRSEAERALDRIAAWDHVLAADSVAGALYELVRYFSTRRLFEPHLGELTETYLGVGLHPVLNPILMGSMDRAPLVAYEILVENDGAWLREPRAALLAHALYQAVHYLQTAIGPDDAAWSWGRIHPAGFHHPMGSKKPLDRIFDRGPFPYGGDTNTVWQAAFVPRLPIKPEGGFTASWRQIFDVGNWDDARGVNTTGQSGHPASPHYDDQIPLWLAGKYHAMPWSRSRVVEAAVDKLLLSPR